MKNTTEILIIGAGPAGLTAAYELLKYTDIKPIIIEINSYVGGISATIDFDGNKTADSVRVLLTPSNNGETR